jgi:hypothetical protein
MTLKSATAQRAFVCLLFACLGVSLPTANAVTCTTQSQLPSAQRETLAAAARTIVEQIKNGQVQALQANTIPAVAADFSGIASSVQSLKPVIQSSTVTVDTLFLLDASTNPATPSRIDFYCGSPVVALNFGSLPGGTYSLAILHATGVPQPQQISIILSQAPGGRWMLAGFFSKPMIAAGHDGLWYWVSARRYAQSKQSWDAWIYYRMASNLLDPVNFLSSPNLEKLQRESDAVRPSTFPGPAPISLNADGASFSVTSIDTTTLFGGLDLDIQYSADPMQATQLHDPPSARKQVTQVMAAILALHPELQSAFHGIWVHANEGTNSLFALELPMNQIVANPKPASVSSTSVTKH